jgi:hypothetical protein
MTKKGLPRKYAKMGFKRGWAEYKKLKNKGKSKSKPTRMARRKTTRRRRYNRKILTPKNLLIAGVLGGGIYYWLLSQKGAGTGTKNYYS